MPTTTPATTSITPKSNSMTDAHSKYSGFCVVLPGSFDVAEV